MPSPPKLNFEKTLAQLEATISKLEDEQVTLQESLTAFEQGITLTRKAQQALFEAEQKVKLLLAEDGEPVATEYPEPGAE